MSTKSVHTVNKILERYLLRSILYADAKRYCTWQKNQKNQEQNRITQEKLADKAKLSTTFIGLLETGQRRASLKSLQKIASALGVKVN